MIGPGRAKIRRTETSLRGAANRNEIKVKDLFPADRALASLMTNRLKADHTVTGENLTLPEAPARKATGLMPERPGVNPGVNRDATQGVEPDAEEQAGMVVQADRAEASPDPIRKELEPGQRPASRGKETTRPDQNTGPGKSRNTARTTDRTIEPARRNSRKERPPTINHVKEETGAVRILTVTANRRADSQKSPDRLPEKTTEKDLFSRSPKPSR